MLTTHHSTQHIHQDKITDSRIQRSREWICKAGYEKEQHSPHLRNAKDRFIQKKYITSKRNPQSVSEAFSMFK